MLNGGVSFRLFRIPIQAQIWFFLTIFFLSFRRLDNLAAAPLLSILLFVEAVVVAAIAVLVHELGHAFAYRRYHQEPRIVLWGLGGLTYGQRTLPPKQSIIVSVAGPLAGIILMGLPAWALQQYVLPGRLPYNELGIVVASAVADVKWFALIWSLVNLVPLLPLDGGHVAESIFELVTGSPRRQTVRIISVVTGAVLGVGAFVLYGSTFALFFGGGLAALNAYQYYQERRGSPSRVQLEPMTSTGDGGGGSVVSMDSARRKRDRRSAPELTQSAYQLLERRDYRGTLKTVDRMRSKRLSSDLSRQATEIAVLAWLGERNPARAAEELGKLPKGADSSRPLLAVLAVTDKRVEDGLAMMVRSLAGDPPSPNRIIAVDLFAEQGMIHRLARALVDLDGGSGFEAAVALEGMLHQLNRTQDASTVSDVILLG